MSNTRRLGRGLDFLLAGEAPPTAEASTVPIDKIDPNPWQPRSGFDASGLEELSESIKVHGVVQPVVVRLRPSGRYELIAGERRLRAAKLAGLSQIPAVQRDVTDEQMLPLALIENVQRSDLNALERARAFETLSRKGLSHQEIARVAGLARSTVSNSLRLLELDDASKAALESGHLTEGHARALLAETDLEKRRQLLHRFLEEPLSVRQAEARTGNAAKQKHKATPEARVLEKNLRESLGMSVRIQESGQKGKVVIRYGSLEEFDALYRRLTGEAPDV